MERGALVVSLAQEALLRKDVCISALLALLLTEEEAAQNGLSDWRAEAQAALQRDRTALVRSLLQRSEPPSVSTQALEQSRRDDLMIQMVDLCPPLEEVLEALRVEALPTPSKEALSLLVKERLLSLLAAKHSVAVADYYREAVDLLLMEHEVHAALLELRCDLLAR